MPDVTNMSVSNRKIILILVSIIQFCGDEIITLQNCIPLYAHVLHNSGKVLHDSHVD
jgi:hypothetical protein